MQEVLSFHNERIGVWLISWLIAKMSFILGSVALVLFSIEQAIKGLSAFARDFNSFHFLGL